MLYEHVGDNRSGKTFTNALFAWEAYNLGRAVYCNCSQDIERPGEYLCILNFPHYHIDMDQIRRTNLFNCYVMSDESVEVLEARRAMKNTVLELTYFNRRRRKGALIGIMTRYGMKILIPVSEQTPTSG